MTDLQQKRIEIRKLKQLLAEGDQRELARRLDTHPSRISDALAGLVKNMDFLNGLETEIRNILTEREAVQSGQ